MADFARESSLCSDMLADDMNVVLQALAAAGSNECLNWDGDTGAAMGRS
jgi:hypothetical protein